jgi:nicotinamidase-related amidase
VTYAATNAQPMIVGTPVLVVIDVQKGAFLPWEPTERLPLLPDCVERMHRVRSVVDAARSANIPIIFFQEVHRPNMIDFGRELDGTEAVHCLETSPGTDFAFEEMGIQPSDYLLSKRRYSCFYGTELEILLKGLKADTLILTGGFTDVCVHYTYVDAHQGDYYVRVVEDCVTGSSQAAHDASLNAMEYLQTGARRSAADIIAGFGARTQAAAE